MKVEEILKTLTEEIANMISTKTVIGEHITIEGRTIIPVTKVSFGFGSGGGEGKGKSGDEGFGGGGGGGAVIQPVAFLVISKEDVKVYSVKDKGIVSQLAEVIPEIIDKCRSSREEGKKEEKPE
ncbi:MAG: spore germination protein GerW family protein [Candidatus Methanoperedens sp.]|nr:spore germination protein GerW family protein [Candidatus Methanoperedens sp.]MCZ7371482.1 spore germination protein GerW family protein [Candidatus Methanoperedens sp.]